ncbi:WIZ isoform 2, partial [Pongo abelii]
MEGSLAGSLAAPDRPRGPERLPGPTPRENIEGGAEAAEGEGGIFRSTRYLPVTKDGPRDILDGRGGISVANFDPGTFSLMRCDFCGAGFDTRAGLSSHARAHLRDFGITNWELTVSPINILQELLATSAAEQPP